MLVTLLAGIGILVCSVAWPSLINISELSRMIASERERSEKHINRALEYGKTLEKVQEIKTVMPKWDKLFIVKGEEIKLFSELENKHRSYNLQQTILLGQQQSVANNLMELPLDIETRGDFRDTLRYVDEIERGATFMPVKNISFGGAKITDKKINEITAMIKSAVYVNENK